jgi:uncharacterized membrane protein
MDHGWMILMMLMALFWGLVVIASIWVLHSITGDPSAHGETAVEALDRSLARGEISADDYRERQDAIPASILRTRR